MSAVCEQVRVFAPAKINWILTIRSRRPDGYHDLDTVFQALNWGDELICRRLRVPRCRLLCDAPGVPLGDDNLVARAWRLLREAFGGRVGGLEVRLLKRIPVGAGWAAAVPTPSPPCAPSTAFTASVFPPTGWQRLPPGWGATVRSSCAAARPWPPAAANACARSSTVCPRLAGPRLPRFPQFDRRGLPSRAAGPLPRRFARPASGRRPGAGPSGPVTKINIQCIFFACFGSRYTL